MIENIYVEGSGQGLVEITDLVQQCVRKHDMAEGLCTLMIQHTSASLLIQENADPSVQTDLHNWMARLVPEHDPLYTHTQEGPDDMPAHIKSMLTQSNLSIPVVDGRLCLGTWQGIYLWEHRHYGRGRQVVVHLLVDH